jgi:hypothetical protein
MFGGKIRDKLPNRQKSILGPRSKAPDSITVMLPSEPILASPSSLILLPGEATHLDFQSILRVGCNPGREAYLNIGSAVILPEIFLKLLP